jgi:hypothetical protein
MRRAGTWEKVQMRAPKRSLSGVHSLCQWVESGILIAIRRVEFINMHGVCIPPDYISSFTLTKRKHTKYSALISYRIKL